MFEEIIKFILSYKDILKKLDVFKQVMNKYSADFKQEFKEEVKIKIEFNSKVFTNNFVYVKNFFKTPHNIFFRLTNKRAHVSFNDKTQMILRTDGT